MIDSVKRNFSRAAGERWLVLIKHTIWLWEQTGPPGGERVDAIFHFGFYLRPAMYVRPHVLNLTGNGTRRTHVSRQFEQVVNNLKY